LVEQEFNELRPAVDSVGVPLIDLRNTFRSVANLDDLQVVLKSDVHPTFGVMR
jgi:hypothetical protein